MSVVLSLHVASNVFELLGNFSSLETSTVLTPSLAFRRFCLLRHAVELPSPSPTSHPGRVWGSWPGELAPPRVTPGTMGGCCGGGLCFLHLIFPRFLWVLLANK